MAETTNTAKTANTAKAPKPSFIKGLKAEFRKIVWPDQETVAKQSATVVVVTVLLGTVRFWILPLRKVSTLFCFWDKGDIYGRCEMVCGAYLFRL